MKCDDSALSMDRMRFVAGNLRKTGFLWWGQTVLYVDMVIFQSNIDTNLQRAWSYETVMRCAALELISCLSKDSMDYKKWD